MPKLLLTMALVLPLITPIHASAFTCGWTSGWLARENVKDGATGWSSDIPVLASPWDREEISQRAEGFFNRVSVGCGEKAKLKITKPARIEMYRLGYYNGAGARLIRTAAVKEYWSFTVTPEISPGQYVVKILRSGSLPRLVPIMVIDRNSDAPITFVSSVYTWQAYNRTGGKSLYKGEKNTAAGAAKIVSFDRPYDNAGTGRMRWMETPLLKMLEENGVDVNYLTDEDVSDETLRRTQSIVLPGHSEYWTESERAAFDSAVERGVNLVAFGGNTGYRKIDIKDRTIGNRVSFRDIGKPESTLLGSMYFALNYYSDLMVQEPDQWPFDSIAPRTNIAGIYGYEVDTYMDAPVPEIAVLALSTDEKDEKRATTTYYNNANGAGVLNLASNGWVCALENTCPWGHRFDAETVRDIRTVTAAVIADLDKGPLAKIHPALTTVAAR